MLACQTAAFGLALLFASCGAAIPWFEQLEEALPAEIASESRIAHRIEPASFASPGEKDRVTDLPGLVGDVNFKHYAGYVDIGNGKELFYWFVESQNVPEEDPVVLWTNGGPGCSGVGGLLSENGPFRAMSDGTLRLHEYSWNKIANVIFVEQPAGVGFSKAPAEMEYGDEQAAEDNFRFIEGFYLKFPQYAQLALYIAGESYGGHYVPQLALKLQQRGMASLRGMLVGNPLTWQPYRTYGQYATYAGHSVVPQPLFQQYQRAACDLDPAANHSLCSSLRRRMDHLAAHLFHYGLDFPRCHAAKHHRHRHHPPPLTEQQLFRRAMGERSLDLDLRHQVLEDGARDAAGEYFVEDYQACAYQYMTTYLNNRTVQQALHVRSEEGALVEWTVCDNEINKAWPSHDKHQPMMGIYSELLKAEGDLKILVYSGDNDAVCSTIANELWIWEVGPVDQEWEAWLYEGQVAGYRVGLGQGSRFQFATVHGAGHFVPETRPAQALALLSSFLRGQW